MFLFQSTDDPTAEGSFQGKGVYSFMDSVSDAIGDALSPTKLQEYFLKLEDEAIKTSRKITGSIQGYSKSLQTTMFKVHQATIDIGGSTKDVLDYAEAYSQETGRVPALIEEQVIAAVRLSKEFGLSTKEIANMAGEFAKLGQSQSASIDLVKLIGTTARKNMVNVGALTKVVQENLKKSSAYSFKDGVKGLTEMAAKAERLGVKLESSFKLFDDFLDPDKAIEFTTQMQLLGGEFANQFGDVYTNMGADVDEIRERLTKVASSQAMIDPNTGGFKLTNEGLMAMRFLSEKTGESVEDLTSVALQARKKMEILNKTGFKPEIDEADRELIASAAEFKDGTWKVQIPVMDNLGKVTQQWTDVASVTAKQMDDFKKVSEDIKSDDGDSVIKDTLLSTSERQVIVLNEIKNTLVASAGLSGGQKFLEAADKLSAAALASQTKIDAEADTVKNFIIDATTQLSDWISTDLRDLIADAYALLVPPSGPLSTREDSFSSPVNEGNLISGPKGSFLTIPDDEILTAPNISEFINASMTAFNTLDSIQNNKSLSSTNLSGKISTKLQEILVDSISESKKMLKGTPFLKEQKSNLSEVINSNVTTNVNTTNTQKVEGGFTITIDASKVPSNLDPIMLKNQIMDVMYKMGDEMKKQGVLNFKL